jgi:hypothetical protein
MAFKVISVPQQSAPTTPTAPTPKGSFKIVSLPKDNAPATSNFLKPNFVDKALNIGATIADTVINKPMAAIAEPITKYTGFQSLIKDASGMAGIVGQGLGSMIGGGLRNLVGADKADALGAAVKNSSFKKNADTVVNTVAKDKQVQMGLDTVRKVSEAAANVVGLKTGYQQLATSEPAQLLKNKITSSAPASETSAATMQRVARIPKGSQARFEQMSGGESVGQYLEKRAIYGKPETIIQKLWDRFTKSKETADAALSKLQGRYNPPQVKTALDELLAREMRVSSPGAASPDLARVQELSAKMQTGGLNMSEINEIKRLFERNVKLDFIKSNAPESVARANNIDSSIRNWQFSEAERLGLKNLPALNQETRLARQLVDDLGREFAGSAGNNAVSITDWIMLSGGDVRAISGLIAKKFFGSKGVQSFFSKLIGNKIDQVPVQPEFGKLWEQRFLPAQSGPGNIALPYNAPTIVDSPVMGGNYQMRPQLALPPSNRASSPMITPAPRPATIFDRQVPRAGSIPSTPTKPQGLGKQSAQAFADTKPRPVSISNKDNKGTKLFRTRNDQRS